ncbi:AraC family transcriptional regulator [Granulicella sp. S156]|uniref:helix-turn-helix domain-containing protein n=1 Tax=Granulicella sp. S156 TaxID=1747224 RepID=UPI00131CEF2D|nr:AraC family transcriptional regulator [Granulicella sp. S156]
MKPYLEYITTPRDASWVLFDRRLERIPFEWHYNAEYELTLTLNSRGQRFVGDNISFYDDGDLVLIGPKIPHTWCSTEAVKEGQMHQALVLWFTEAFVRGMIDPHVELHPIRRLLESSGRALTFSEPIRAKAQKMICDMLGQTSGTRIISLLNLLLLLAADSQTSFLTSVANQPVNLPTAAEERIGHVISYLHEHYREPIEVSKLMRIAALSRSSLHRLFKLHTFMTTNEYVVQLRIGNACALLINSQKPISVIADEVGYNNLANFNRQFKALKNKTPRDFRAAFARP